MAPETAINLLQTIRQEIKKLSYMPSKIHLTPEEPWRSHGVRRAGEELLRLLLD